MRRPDLDGPGQEATSPRRIRAPNPRRNCQKLRNRGGPRKTALSRASRGRHILLRRGPARRRRLTRAAAAPARSRGPRPCRSRSDPGRMSDEGRPAFGPRTRSRRCRQGRCTGPGLACAGSMHRSDQRTLVRYACLDERLSAKAGADGSVRGECAWVRSRDGKERLGAECPCKSESLLSRTTSLARPHGQSRRRGCPVRVRQVSPPFL